MGEIKIEFLRKFLIDHIGKEININEKSATKALDCIVNFLKTYIDKNELSIVLDELSEKPSTFDCVKKKLDSEKLNIKPEETEIPPITSKGILRIDPDILK